jgi:hypothetical protein
MVSCRYTRTKLFLFLICAVLLQAQVLLAEEVAVRHTEGLMHGFVVVRTLDGKTLADGEMMQVAQGDQVKDELILHFKDGSIYDDTTIFTQRGHFRLLNDHLVMKGPTFKHPMETWIDASSGQVTVSYMDDDGKAKVLSQRLDLPPDVSNGLMLTLVKHIQPTVPQTTVSWIATTPKPLPVKVMIVPQGQERFSSGTIQHTAMHYVAKIKIGGITGLLAGLLGKKPPDTHVWVLGGDAPAFVKMEGPLYDGGPVWRVELATPAGFP